MTDTLNLNSADCLKTVRDIGVNHIHNICTGAVTDVPWGSLDWFVIIILGGVFAAVFATLIGFAIMFIREY